MKIGEEVQHRNGRRGKVERILIDSNTTTLTVRFEDGFSVLAGDISEFTAPKDMPKRTKRK